MAHNVCEYGFKCPYACDGEINEEYELICTYPKLAKDVSPDELFYACNETNCELMDYDSEISYIMRVYEVKLWDEINNEIEELRKQDKRWVAEWKKHREECDRRRNEWEEKHGRQEI